MTDTILNAPQTDGAGAGPPLSPPPSASVSAPATAGFWQRSPGWFLGGVAALGALALLVAAGAPGTAWAVGLLAAVVLLACALVWAIRLLTFAIAAIRRRPTGAARGFAVAPLGGLIVVALLWTHVPLRVGFAVSRPAFDRAAAAARRTDQDTFGSQRIGAYEITQVVHEGDAILFYEANGAFMDDAGFAYLPHGPTADLENAGFENPQWTHLGGRWYAWVASW